VRDTRNVLERRAPDVLLDRDRDEAEADLVFIRFFIERCQKLNAGNPSSNLKACSTFLNQDYTYSSCKVRTERLGSDLKIQPKQREPGTESSAEGNFTINVPSLDSTTFSVLRNNYHH
jgi:hypothetical protein